jgi:hypothetical protein
LTGIADEPGDDAHARDADLAGDLRLDVGCHGRGVPGTPRSCLQCGRTLALRWPHFVHRMRGPNAGTDSSSGQASTLTVV